MKRKNKDKRATARQQVQQDDQPGGLTHNPFAALRKGPPGEAPDPGPPEPEPGPETAPEPAPKRAKPGAAKAPSASAGGSRLVVRREKRGRAGKTVTRVTGLDVKASELDALAREMKRALGCGASIEDADVLLQGAMTERAAAWLEKRFETRVTIGN